MANKNPSSAPATTRPTHEQIAERARQLWAERGNPAGRDFEHWLEAERQLSGTDVPADPPSSRGSRSDRRGQRDSSDAEKRLDGLIEAPPSPARRTPSGEQL